MNIKIVVLIIGVFIAGVLLVRSRQKKLNACSEEITARIIDTYEKKGRSYIKYKYSIEGKSYTTSESLKSKFVASQLSIGDSITVKVSCDDFNISKYIA